MFGVLNNTLVSTAMKRVNRLQKQLLLHALDGAVSEKRKAMRKHRMQDVVMVGKVILDSYCFQLF